MAAINILIIEHEGRNNFQGYYLDFGGVESRFKVFFVMRISALNMGQIQCRAPS
jgi:hypothetical protein